MTTAPAPALLAPLFRATFTSEDDAVDTLFRPEVARWINGIVAVQWRKARVLRMAYEETEFVGHCLGLFVEKVLVGRGFASGDGSPPKDPAAWIATVVRRITVDAFRKAKRRLANEVLDSGPGDDGDQSAIVHADPRPGPTAERVAVDRAELAHVLTKAREKLGESPRRLGIFLAFVAPGALSRADIEAASREGGALFVRPPDETLHHLRALGQMYGAPVHDAEIQAEVAWVLGCRDPLATSWDAWKARDSKAALTARDTTQKMFRRAREVFVSGFSAEGGT